MAASLSDVVRTNTTADLCLYMAHTEIISLCSTQHNRQLSLSPGVGLQIVSTELRLTSVRTEERAGLRDPALPHMSQLDIQTMETGGLEQPADILVVLVI